MTQQQRDRAELPGGPFLLNITESHSSPANFKRVWVSRSASVFAFLFSTWLLTGTSVAGTTGLIAAEGKTVGRCFGTTGAGTAAGTGTSTGASTLTGSGVTAGCGTDSGTANDDEVAGGTESCRLVRVLTALGNPGFARCTRDCSTKWRAA